MGILGFLLLGLIAGAVAKMLMPGADGGGVILTMVLGVVGAMLGGFLGAVLFDINPIDQFFDISTWAAAIIGSMIVLAVYRAVTGNERNRDVI